MAGFFATLTNRNQLQDGTRRAVMETVVQAREGVEQARNRLDGVISDLMRENDRITKRQQRNVEKPSP
jgi:hypothetical protein